MVRRFFAGFLTATLTAALLVFGGATPAQAQSLGSCSKSPFQLQVGHEPRMFHYRLTADRAKNNVNIRIHRSDGALLWAWNSPDDRRGGIWYHIQPSVAVPPGGFATFTAIFDVSWGSDPQCTYTALACCGSQNKWWPNGVTTNASIFVPWGVSPPYLVHTTGTLQLHAQLNGYNNFEFVIKTTGLADAFFQSQSGVINIPLSYAGRTVRVSARAISPGPSPWSFPELSIVIPPLPPPPPPPPPPPCEPVPPELICTV